jgi:V/A-type H+-transporting ATPase subunit K
MRRRKRMDTGTGLALIAAGVAVGIAALGTGVAQAQIGAAAVGATAENPKMFGKGLALMVLPETLVIFGFVIAIMLIGKA